jgi:hypothetical protein
VPVTYDRPGRGRRRRVPGQLDADDGGRHRPLSRCRHRRTVRTNLEGAKYTLATNEAGAALGIKDFADIADHKDALEGKIYGIEPAMTATA